VLHLFNAPGSGQPSTRAPTGPEAAAAPGGAVFDLILTMIESGDGLRGRFEYNTDLFDPATIERLAGHLVKLLQEAVAAPDIAIQELPLLADTERHRALTEWNRTAHPFPRDRGIAALFADQAARTPHAPAFFTAAETITYAELDERARVLATRLAARGAGPGVLVGVCLERSIDSAVAVLAVFAAGAAYLPLDPSLPRDRIAFMVEDAGARVVVTNEATAPLFDEAQLAMVRVDDPEPADAAGESARPEVRHSDLAYVLYTSGSTGRPKGVAVEHEQVLNRLHWMWTAYPFAAGEVGCAKTPLGFVDSLWELLGPVLRGVPTLVLGDDEVKDPFALVDALADAGVTRIWIVPSLLRAVLDTYPDLGPRLPALTFWVTSGEALDPDLNARFRSALPNATLYNLYGTSEAWDVTWYDPGGAPAPSLRVPIGRPIWNMRAYVLDGLRQPVPLGVAGDLYVGGVGLARGYLNQPELTRKTFVPDPFSADPGARMYCTGDRARLRVDGSIEYIGRSDHQVKLRGFRIELGEIEATLRDHPGVSDAAVLLDARGSGEPRLIAHVEQNPDYRGSDGAGGRHWSDEQVPRWRAVWDQTYADAPGRGEELSFDSSAFTSSYTGRAIPEEEVLEWVEHPVSRVLARRPDRVLEIGCGTGLLLTRIAPHCSRYVGTDFSEVAIDRLRAAVGDSDRLSHVELSCQAADDPAGIEQGEFDAVVLNSVIQYFPDVEYAVRVIERAARAVEQGGFVFVGDVRSLPLLEAFHVAVELARAAPATPLAEFRQRVARRMSQEKELLLHPDFFAALSSRVPSIRQVMVRLKRGARLNEFTRFRYDAILEIGPTAQPAPALEKALDWEAEGLSVDGLQRLLVDLAPQRLWITGVPNARLAAEVVACEVLHGDASATAVADLKAAVADARKDAVDPEAIWRLGRDLRYAADIRACSGSSPARFDVVLERVTGDAPAPAAVDAPTPGRTRRPRPWTAYANNPLEGLFAQKLMPELRSFLDERLPDYMVPSAFVLAHALPKTPSGKIDRLSLPSPDTMRRELERTYVAPRAAAEQVMVGIWEDVLGIEGIGVTDDFFAELGGHSLLATQVVSRSRETFQVDLPLGTLFEGPTVAGLVAAMESDPVSGPRVERTAKLLLEVAEMSEEEVEAMLSSRQGS
jgi:amino acid adenylation domain-containing protein